MRRASSGARKITRFAVLLLLGAGQSVYAFQIAPLSSSWEEKLTREPASTRAKIAGKLGRLLKGPVHEEIAQLAMGCPVSEEELLRNTECADVDQGFATQFIIYGVRWNDLPPFRLREKEGRRCTKVFSPARACDVSQTVRFATQPVCWYCLFKSAEKVAASGRKIVGCLPADRPKGSRFITANLLARSHFGDLQFLHSMAQEDGVDPAQTRADILGWLEFAWKVATREISHGTLLRDVNIPVIKSRFNCSGWAVADLYVLGRQDSMLGYIHDIAFGSILHTVQDSFAEGHVDREPALPGARCAPDLPLQRPGSIREFHSYGGQDGHLHDAKDERAAMVRAADGKISGAVAASRQLAAYYGERRKWMEVEPYMQCLFTLATDARQSSAGAQFRRR